MWSASQSFRNVCSIQTVTVGDALADGDRIRPNLPACTLRPCCCGRTKTAPGGQGAQHTIVCTTLTMCLLRLPSRPLPSDTVRTQYDLVDGHQASFKIPMQVPGLHLAFNVQSAIAGAGRGPLKHLMFPRRHNYPHSSSFRLIDCLGIHRSTSPGPR